jgi:hypothetical protein
MICYIPAPRRWRGYTILPLSVCPSVLPPVLPSVLSSVLPSVQDIFRCIFLSNCWLQKPDIWSQASYRYTILWVALLDPSDSYFLFGDLVGFFTHWTYMHIFRHIFLSNHWWQKSDIWSQASYRYPISWEAFLDPSDSYFLLPTLLIFIHIEHPFCISPFLVAFFSATIDGRNLKRFLTRQIPTSCLLKSRVS